MRRPYRQRHRSFAVLGLFLVVLANLGLTVHEAHGALGADHAVSTTLSLADHQHRDLSLHLEAVTEIRTFSCPGCQLHHQLGGTLLPVLAGLEEPSAISQSLEPTRDALRPEPQSSTHPRGPPSC